MDNVQLAIEFTEREFFEMCNEIYGPYPVKRDEYFNKLIRESFYLRYLLRSRDIKDLILKERYSEKKMKSILAPFKVDKVLPKVWMWENKKILELDVNDIWNDLEVYVHYDCSVSYSTN